MPSLLRTMCRRLAALLLVAVLPVGAVTLRIANQGDAFSMDPHALGEAVQLGVTGNVYEGLVERDRNFQLAPALAMAWRQLDATTWRFELRRNVRFHDGTPLTAEDVVFSWQRARDSGVALLVAPIAGLRKIDDFNIEIVTSAPFPILPLALTGWYIMSKAWSVAHQAERAVDRRTPGAQGPAALRANGTGPFVLRERLPGVRTTFRRNADYWRAIESNIDEVVFHVLGNDASRVAALVSGQVDVIDPVPIQDVERIAAHPQLKVVQGPEIRVLFLGMDQQRDELLFSSVKGRNPFRDRRVRQAIFQAIDIEAIRATVMRGASMPSGLLVPPEVNGYAADVDVRPAFDPQAARRLLAEAGYADGFEVNLNCPNDRYVNDHRICQALAAQLARVGVRVNVDQESKTLWLPRLNRRETSFFLSGWASSTVDAHNVLFAVMASPGEKGRGSANAGAYSNSQLDALTQQIATTIDPVQRNAMIRDALKLHQDDIGHIPLHRQYIQWGARRNVTLRLFPTARMPWRFITMQP